MSSTVVVAIDGPSGSGKSSTSRGVAAKLGLRYLDTGAMFRAMTWFMLREGVDVSDPAAVAAKANTPLIESGTNPDKPTITVDGTDVAAAIREQTVTNAVSPVSAVPEVRARLLELQRAEISEGGIVVEGRDIGSVVWPQAAGEGLPDRRRRRPRRTPGGRGGRLRRVRHRGLAAGPRRDRLRPGDRAAGDAGRRAPHRHHAVHPRRGDLPGRRAGGGRSGPGGARACAAPLTDLPRVDTVRPPHDRFFRTFRPSGRAALRTLWRVRNHGTHHLPERGPVILASNHVGLMDGPLLAIFCPRPVHALTKREMFDGRTGHGLRAVGQIPLDRTEVDPAAVKTCLRVLDQGKVVGIYPEGARGAGDFAAPARRGRLPRAGQRGARSSRWSTSAPARPVAAGTRCRGAAAASTSCTARPCASRGVPGRGPGNKSGTPRCSSTGSFSRTSIGRAPRPGSTYPDPLPIQRRRTSS